MPFWLILGPFWCHLGPDLAYFVSSGVSFWLVLGEIQFLRQKFVKKHSCIDPGIKFLANYRMQTIFPRPGGGTIAAGNRDSPPGRLRPVGSVGVGSWMCLCLHAPSLRTLLWGVPLVHFPSSSLAPFLLCICQVICL